MFPTKPTNSIASKLAKSFAGDKSPIKPTSHFIPSSSDIFKPDAKTQQILDEKRAKLEKEKQLKSQLE